MEKGTNKYKAEKEMSNSLNNLMEQILELNRCYKEVAILNLKLMDENLRLKFEILKKR
jgi:hypothetical protein